MSTKVFLRFVFIGSLFFIFFLSGCGGSTSSPIGNRSPDNGLDIYDIHVHVDTKPNMDVNTAYQVSASISSPDSDTPLTDLIGVLPDGRKGPLYKLLQPSSKVGDFALCMYVTLNWVDFPFTLDSPAEKQWVVLAQDGNNAQSSNIWKKKLDWNFRPQDPDGRVEEMYTIKAIVGFDARVSCNSSSPSLLPHEALILIPGHNTIVPTSVTFTDVKLQLENGLISTPRKIIIIVLPTAQGLLIGWITRAPSLLRKLLGRSSSSESNQEPPFILPQQKKWISGCRIAICILLLVFGTLIMLVGFLSIYFDDPSTIYRVSVETLITLVGMALMLAGAWWIRLKKGTSASFSTAGK